MILVHVGHVMYRPESGTPYHLSRALSKYFSVVYINPIAGLWQWYQWHSRMKMLGILRENVRVVTPVAPGGLRFLPRSWRKLPIQTLTLFQLVRLFRQLRNQQTILWVSNSELALRLHAILRPTLTCYHRLDDFGAMDPNLAELELALERIADIVFVVSPHLIPHHQSRGRQAILLPNAVSAEMFSTALNPTTPIPEDLLAIPEPRIGFIGWITPKWVDIELIFAVAQNNPHWHFVLVGPCVNWHPTVMPQNVHHLGVRPYHQLPHYLKGMNVCLLPFKKNGITKGASPLKFYEYLAAGRAIVSTYVPEVDYFDKLVWQADTPEEFSQAIHDALKNAHDPVLQQKRVQAIQPHTWEVRAEQVYQHINKYLLSHNRSKG